MGAQGSRPLWESPWLQQGQPAEETPGPAKGAGWDSYVLNHSAHFRQENTLGIPW